VSGSCHKTSLQKQPERHTWGIEIVVALNYLNYQFFIGKLLKELTQQTPCNLTGGTSNYSFPYLALLDGVRGNIAGATRFFLHLFWAALRQGLANPARATPEVSC
jgi:hypothetical protein